MAGRATGQTQTAQVATGRGRASERPAAGSAAAAGGTEPASRTWIHRAYLAGRIGVFAIPILAIVAAFGAPDHAFSLNPAVYANFVADRWSSPMTIATTTGTGALAIISVISLALLLAGTRARWIALAGVVIGVAGAVMMLLEVGSVVVRSQGIARPVIDGRLDRVAITAASHGTHAAIMVFGGAALLTLGWVLLGIAIMLTYGLNKGDGGLLIVAAPMVFLGGFFLHTLPTMGAFLLGAAGLGLILTAGRISPDTAAWERPARVPAPAMSAFARFTDDDLDALYRAEEEPVAYAAPVSYQAVTVPDDPAHAGIGRARGSSAGFEVHRSETGVPEATPIGATATAPIVEPKPAKRGFSFTSWSPFRSGDKPPATDTATPTPAGPVNGSAEPDPPGSAPASADTTGSQVKGNAPNGAKAGRRKKFSTSVSTPDDAKSSGNQPSMTSPTRTEKAGNAPNSGSGKNAKRPEASSENGPSAQAD